MPGGTHSTISKAGRTHTSGTLSPQLLLLFCVASVGERGYRAMVAPCVAVRTGRARSTSLARPCTDGCLRHSVAAHRGRLADHAALHPCHRHSGCLVRGCCPSDSKNFAVGIGGISHSHRTWCCGSIEGLFCSC